MFIEIPASKRSISQRKLVYGIGINDADYVTQPSVNGRQVTCGIYKAWRGMLERCYCEKTRHNNPSYRDCTVFPDWLIFSNFKKWMANQDWKGNELDKDIIKVGNKVYHPDLCAFVSQDVNKLLSHGGFVDNGMPPGVYYHKKGKVFIAQIGKHSKVVYIGSYSTPLEAGVAYAKAKGEHILHVASQQDEERIKNGLAMHAEYWLSKR